MGKRYYCDYCDKSFADNATNRKNHLMGVYHQKQKKAHYDSFIKRDPAKVLAESSKLPLCHNFKTTGECHYGVNCRWSHVTDKVREELENEIRSRREATQKQRQEEEKVPTLEEWLDKRSKKLKTEEDVKSGITEPSDEAAVFQLPVCSLPPVLANIPNLPPSLLPPPPDAYKYLPLEEWG
ncbi:zinc finger matrin-type protein 5-like [Haliotis rufescens]|uniref:zinc finger matrin-type protein 5-like n=1 Tax=Haliotis rufescens TaxID=6454 RepID=UPI00201F715D|nr:zinc finger matrin-type protein 5-like [Haliotis rufescens]